MCVRAATAGIERVCYSGGEGGFSGPGYPAHGDEISFVRGEVGEFVLELVDEMGDLFFHGSGGGGIGCSSDSNSKVVVEIVGKVEAGLHWTGKVSTYLSYREEAGEGTHRSIDRSRGTK